MNLYQDVVLAELTKTHAEAVAPNVQVLRDGRAMSLKHALERFDDQLDKAAQSIVQSKTLAACSQDPAFARAATPLHPHGNGRSGRTRWCPRTARSG